MGQGWLSLGFGGRDTLCVNTPPSLPEQPQPHYLAGRYVPSKASEPALTLSCNLLTSPFLHALARAELRCLANMQQCSTPCNLLYCIHCHQSSTNCASLKEHPTGTSTWRWLNTPISLYNTAHPYQITTSIFQYASTLSLQYGACPCPYVIPYII